MTGVAAGIAVAATVAAGVAASTIAKKKAADKAAKAQKNAISAQEQLLRKKLDPGALNRLAQQTDKERALNRIALQKEVDPEIADLREFSKQKLLDLAQQPESTRQTTQVANQLFQEGIKEDPRIAALKDSIINRAQEDFDAGATLPPDFQAELVRAGIGQGAQAGVGTAGRTVGGLTSRLLGSAGINLKAQRTAEGTALAGAAQNLTDARQRILANIFPTDKATEDAAAGRATAGLGIAESLLPESGLTGTQAADVQIAQTKGAANLLGQRGNVAAQQATDQGNYVAGLIGAGTSLVSGVYGAGAGGAAAGAGGGGGGINYGSLAQSIIGGGGNAGGITNNPYYGLQPGQVPYGYQGDPSTLVNTRRI
jgi:hypothetical protein